MKKNKGFTLIELLVVIAIIGILASVVLAALSSARLKGQDAAIQSELASMRAQAELFYNSTGNSSYGVASTACSGTGSLFDSAAANSLYTLLHAITTTPAPDCGSTPGTTSTSWSVAATGASPSTAFCVDSTGVSRKVNAAGVPYTIAMSTTSSTTVVPAHSSMGATACN